MKGFKKGARVRLTAAGIQVGFGARKDRQKPHNNLGTVTSNQHNEMVRVRRNGYKASSSFHETFWTWAEKQAPEPYQPQERQGK